MSIQPTNDFLVGLISELRKQPAETTWLEFKQSRAAPEDIGEYISAIANMAALAGKANGYVVWGIEDGTHHVVGTTFHPSTEKRGNEDLLNWLVRLLTPRIHFEFFEVQYDGKPVVLLEDKREVELVWNGKSRDVCTAILPFRTLGHIDEPRKEGGLGVSPELFDTSGRQIEDAGGLKLIYIDPPFDVGASTRAEERTYGHLPLTRQCIHSLPAALAATDRSPAIHRRDLPETQSRVA